MIYRLKCLLAAAALLAAPGALAQASDWRFMAQAIGKVKTIMLFDAAAVTSPTPDTRQATIANYRSASAKTAKANKYNAYFLTYRYDCKARTMQGVRSELVFDDVVVESSDAGGEPQSVDSGNPAAELFDAVCSGDYSKFRKIRASTPLEERKLWFGS
jgi:hypothetical protein